MASTQEQQLMAWIRANLGTLNDVRSEQYFDPTKADPFADGGIGVRGQAPAPNATRYLSDTLSQMHG